MARNQPRRAVLRADMTGMVRREVTIINKLGLHARAAAAMVSLAARFQCDVWVVKGDQQVNAKSIMGIMMLAAGKGTVLALAAEGVDAADAVAELEQLVADRFGEPE